MATRFEELQRDANAVGLWVRTYSPGDGVTRYRFFTNAHDSYFGPGNGIYTALGLKEAHHFLRGYGSHRTRPSHPHSRAERKSIETRLTRRSGRRRYRSR